MLIHASCVCWNEKGILFTGPSGSGKSDACLQVISNGGFLVADDQTELCAQNGALIASCPKTIYGKIEARGVGILSIEDVCPETPVHLVVQLVPLNQMERMPELEEETLEGITLPKVKLYPFENSFLIKLEAILNKKVDSPSNCATTENKKRG